MRNLLLLGCITLIFTACSSNDSGVGIVPLDGVVVQGQVVDASSPSGVLLATEDDRTVLLPKSWEYRSEDKTLDPDEIPPNTGVQAFAPPTPSKFVTAIDDTVVLESNDDYFALPLNSLPYAAQNVPVQTQTFGGPPHAHTLPLREAVYSEQFLPLSHQSYRRESFPMADPYSLSTAYVVGGYNGQPLVLTPGPSHVQAMVLPPTYPQTQLTSHQPVRFNYLDNNIQVSTWGALDDGQLDLGKLLLTGTLLQLLPGQAVIEIGQQPMAVPLSNVTYQSRPLRGQRPRGCPRRCGI